MKNKGITLVSLVITVIILIFIAGISIATLSGENGIFEKVKISKEKYSISEAKEKLELAISNLRIEQEGKGENLTKENLPRIDDNEISVGNTSNFPVEIICKDYKFNVDSNFNITYVGKADGTVITYTTTPEGYTNKDEIKILIDIKNPKGIKTIQRPNENDKLIANGEKEVGIDYRVTANGTYTFKVVDVDNNEVIKDIVIDKIDKVEPKDFEPTVKNIGLHGFTVVSNAEDGDATNTSTKSGIYRYEYYIKKSEDTEYIKYDSNSDSYIFSNLEGGTEYQFYIKVYDRAENFKSSTIFNQETDSVLKTIYIDSVNGDDLQGDGTDIKPYSTLEKISEEGIIETGVKYNVYLSEGNYELTEKLYNLNCNKQINIYGKKEKTILKVGKIFGTSFPEGSDKYSLNIFRLIWEGTSMGTNTISVNTPMKLYNIVFIYPSVTQTTVGGAYFYDVNGVYMENCTLTKRFYGMVTGWKEVDSGFIRGNNKVINSYGGFKSGYNTVDSMWNYKTNYITQYEPKVDSTTYRITDDESKWKNVGTGTNPDGSQANLGVYGGEYSWDN